MEDVESWREQAELFAADTTKQLDDFERDVEGAGAGIPARVLWDRARQLGESIRVAPAIESTDKIALQGRLGELVKRLRERQRRVHKEIEETRRDIEGHLKLAQESVGASTTSSELQEVRADLTVLRTRITGLASTIPRSVRTKLWEEWQETNRVAWESLLARWQQNERMLSSLLEEAEKHLERRRTKQAREQIKAFHEAIASHECSHREARALRVRAHELWERCVEQGRVQREHYVTYARRRIEQLRQEVAQNERSRAQLKAEIPALERQVSSSTTGVGHALSRGRLAEALRRLERLDVEDRRLASQISEIEASVGAEVTPAG
jgi:hypothetical protein